MLTFSSGESTKAANQHAMWIPISWESGLNCPGPAALCSAPITAWSATPNACDSRLLPLNRTYIVTSSWTYTLRKTTRKHFAIRNEYGRRHEQQFFVYDDCAETYWGGVLKSALHDTCIMWIRFPAFCGLLLIGFLTIICETWRERRHCLVFCLRVIGRLFHAFCF